MAANKGRKQQTKMNDIPIEDQVACNGEQQFQQNGKTLPNGFAEEILKLEMEIEINDKIQLKSLHRLIELYALGVGYYESIGNSKYQYFHKKMNNLMLKPNVQESMNQAAKEKQVEESRQDGIDNNLMTQKLQQSYIKPKVQVEKEISLNPQADTNSSSSSSQSSSSQQNQQIEEAECSQNSFSKGINNTKQVQEEVMKKKNEEEEKIEVVGEEKKKTKQISLIRKKTIEDNIKMNMIYGMQESEDKSKSIVKMHQIDAQRVKQMVVKQVGSQMDDIKKRLELRRKMQFNQALSLPNNNESDTSLNDIDIALLSPSDNKVVNNEVELHSCILPEIIFEDDLEDHYTNINTKRNSFDHQSNYNNFNIIDTLLKERNIDEIISSRYRRKTTISARKAGRNLLIRNIKLQCKSVEKIRIKSLSNDISSCQSINDSFLTITPFGNFGETKQFKIPTSEEIKPMQVHINKNSSIMVGNPYDN